MASLKHPIDLLPESAGQTDLKYVGGYDPGQGAKVVEPFQVQGAGVFLAQAPRHQLRGLFGAFEQQADRTAGTHGFHAVGGGPGQEEDALEGNGILHIPGTPGLFPQEAAPRWPGVRPVVPL